MGLAAKVLIADTLAHYLAPFVGLPATLATSTSLFVLFGYSFQIYFDFYGYSLIAIGLGRLFGFHLPDNFLRPYESLNPKDFWRRWHVSLSYWIRDYLYLPMGGNRRYHLNIAIVFTLVGLWHGARWNFVVWGLYHAGLVVVYALVARYWDRLPGLPQIALNFLLVSFGWVLFLFDFEGAAAFLQKPGRTGGGNGARRHGRDVGGSGGGGGGGLLRPAFRENSVARFAGTAGACRLWRGLGADAQRDTSVRGSIRDIHLFPLLNFTANSEDRECRCRARRSCRVRFRPPPAARPPCRRQSVRPVPVCS